jgi:hypothetical protein
MKLLHRRLVAEVDGVVTGVSAWYLRLADFVTQDESPVQFSNVIFLS